MTMESRSMRLKISPDRGRSLVALSDFEYGTCILEEIPYVYTVCNEKKDEFCEFCLKTAKLTQSSSLKRCSSCKNVRYCNRSCQEEDWKRCHKKECKTVKKIQPRVPPDMAQLLAKIIWKRKSPPCSQDEDAFPTTVDQLESHHDKLSEARRDNFKILLCALGECIKGDVLPEASSLLKMYGAALSNAFSIRDFMGNDFAMGIYLRASILNHSCDPNCVIVFDERKLYLRTVKDVQKGEECTISYIDVLDPVQERRAKLKERYYFTCKCAKCINEIESQPDDGLDESFLEGLKEAQEKAEKTQDWPAVLKLCEPYLKQTDSSSIANHHLLVKLCNRAFSACVSTQSWEKAAQIGHLNIQQYRYHYGPFYPKLGILYLHLCEINLNLERLEEAESYLKEAGKVLDVTHGRQHTLMKTLVIHLITTCTHHPKNNSR